jgi:protein phosphatase
MAEASDGSMLFAVADGIGGFERGEEASRVAVAAVQSAWLEDPGQSLSWRLARCVKLANDAVFNRTRELELRSYMGTTLIMLAIHQGEGVVANVGDSRAYRLRRGRLQQLSTDHTEAQEMFERHEIDASELDGHELGHMLTRCLGVERGVEPELIGPFALCDDDLYLLCSDGLSGVLSTQELRDLLSYFPFAQQAKELVRLANHLGGPDNISCQLVRICPTLNDEKASSTAAEVAALEPRPPGHRFAHERRPRWILLLLLVGLSLVALLLWLGLS